MDIFRTQLPAASDLPERLRRLHALAYNLWWTWEPEAARLFGRLDYDRWERIGHNPIRLLREIDPARLEQAASDKEYLALYDHVIGSFDFYMNKQDTWTSQTHPELHNKPIAYFSMEFGLH
jgi:starch phosphorylase